MKRRAESVLFPDAPVKVRVCGAHGGGCAAAALRTAGTQRSCTKRAFTEQELRQTRNQPDVSPDHCAQGALRHVTAGQRFPGEREADASPPGVCAKMRRGSVSLTSTQPPRKTKALPLEEDLSCFNSFQFWRAPLPPVDFSFLESANSGKNGCGEIKAVECLEMDEMEY